MRKKTVKAKKKVVAAHTAQPAGAGKGSGLKRRKFLKNLRNVAFGAVAVGGLGYYSVTAVQATICEGDLTKIGKGKPAIVQIHDPQCSLCRSLQNQTRSVLGDFDGDRFEYLVANIKTAKGSALAAHYRVPHVTLLLFDANGKMVQTVRGPTTPQILESVLGSFMQNQSVPSS